jgi:hypothetical protein
MSRHFLPAGMAKGSKFKYVDQEALLSIAYQEWQLALDRTRHMLLQFFKGACMCLPWDGPISRLLGAHVNVDVNEL